MSLRRNMSRAARRRAEAEAGAAVRQISLSPFTSQKLANLVQLRDEANSQINTLISVAASEQGLDLDLYELVGMNVEDDGRFTISLAELAGTPGPGPKLEPDTPADPPPVDPLDPDDLDLSAELIETVLEMDDELRGEPGPIVPETED